MELTFFLLAHVVLSWIWDQDSVDDTGMFFLKTSGMFCFWSMFTHCLDSLCHSVLPGSSLGFGKNLSETQPGHLTQTG